MIVDILLLGMKCGDHVIELIKAFLFVLFEKNGVQPFCLK
jgi:hypothetical protein